MKIRRNIAWVVLLIALLVLMAYVTRPRDRWIPTWHETDRDPYGGYVLHQLMKDRFPDVESKYKSLYELLEDSTFQDNILVASQHFETDSAEWALLENYISGGKTALISTRFTFGVFADTLDVLMRRSPAFASLKGQQQTLSGTAKEDVAFDIPGYPKNNFDIDFSAVNSYLKSDVAPDSLQTNSANTDSATTNFLAETLATASDSLPILRGYHIGKGYLYLSSTPLLLTNYHVLDSASRSFSAGLLSLLPQNKPVSHIEFYRMGRMESQTPLRFILKDPSLSMALWLTVTGLLLLIFFEAKRKQRIIPVLKAPRNTSMDFAATLGHLYYNAASNHSNMAHKRIRFFLDHVRVKYRITAREPDKALTQKLIRNLEIYPGEIEALVKMAARLWNADYASKEDLIRLEKKLHKFYRIDKTSE